MSARRKRLSPITEAESFVRKREDRQGLIKVLINPIGNIYGF